LADVLEQSVNVWFIAAALKLDSAVLSPARSPVNSALGQQSRMVQTARRVFAQKDFDLVADVRFAPRVNARTLAQTIHLDAANGAPDHCEFRSQVAYSGIGQKVQATPLAMSSIMASVKLGRVVTPRITTDANAAVSARRSLWSPDAQPGLAEDLLNHLRGGLQRVVTSGTAHRAFDGWRAAELARLRSQIYGKTGTAEPFDRPKSKNKFRPAARNTAWFAGYVEGDAALTTRVGAIRSGPIAFACVVTETPGYGGGVCAGLIAKLLADIRLGRKL
jgi:cell division protein FtsI/penicillin-binding protein 2